MPFDRRHHRRPLGDETGRLWAVSPGTSVFDALSLMADQNIGAVLVMDGERLCGVLSERDYARKVILTGKTSRDTEVEEIMSEPGVGTRSTTIDECMREMTSHAAGICLIVEDGG